MNGLFLSLSTSPPSIPLSASPQYMIAQWEIGSEERLRFLRQQQLVHLFTPNLHAHDAGSLHKLNQMLSGENVHLLTQRL